MSPRINKSALFADLGYEPHAGQCEIHEATERIRVVACGVRWGKTTCAAMEGLAAALTPAARSVGWVVAPTYDLATRVFREIRLNAEEKLKPYVVSSSESEHRLILTNLGGGRSEIRAKSADNPVSLLGEGLDWLIVDEASRLKPDVWQAYLSQRLIDKRGWALLVSTPKGKGWYYDLFLTGREGHHRARDTRSWNMPSWTNPLLDRGLIEAERGRIPEAHFRQEYGAEFIEGEGSVFRDVRSCATGELSEPIAGRRYVAGVDLAKVTDFTVLVVVDVESRAVVHVDRFHRLAWETQVARLQGTLERYFNPLLFVDSTGAGEPIFDLLVKAGLYARPYTLSNRSKTDLINNLVVMLERREITLPRPLLCPVLIEEMEDFTQTTTPSGAVQMAAPSGRHDDTVIALALAAWGLRRVTPVGGRVSGISMGSGPGAAAAIFRQSLRRSR